MRLRARITAAFTGVTAGALVASFVVAYVFVERDELRELDQSLLVQAEHAAKLAVERAPDDPRVQDGTFEISEPPSLTERYAATYERDGRAVAATRSFGEAPRLDLAGAAAGTSLELRSRGVRLRGVLVPLGARRTLLYAVPRTGVDQDLRFLVRIFAGLFAAATLVTWLVARSLARALVRDVDALCEVSDAVARGRLDARVDGRAKGSLETRLLGDRMDLMIARMEGLVASQRVFVSSAAHELRSPLTSLRGELELALRRDRAASEYKAAIERALVDTVALVSLADDLLAIARSEGRRSEGRRAPAKVAEIVAEALRMSRGNAETAGVDVLTGGDGMGVVLSCSTKEVARAVRNLLDNAISHSPPGSPVHVRAERRGGEVAIVVEDHGRGVRPEDVPHLFAPFWRGSDERAAEAPGAGLGLVLAREIARAEGGDIRFEPELVPGARFVLTLPVEGEAPRGRGRPPSGDRDDLEPSAPTTGGAPTR